MKSLRGRLLVAVPEMADSFFERALVLVCEHEEKNGALGFVVNHPTDLTLRDLLQDLQIEPTVREGLSQPVFLGGPVQPNRGFGLFSGLEAGLSDCVDVLDHVKLTASRELLVQCAAGRRPEDMMIAIGYAGWMPGQLEGELDAGRWWLADSSRELLYTVPPAERWPRALRQLGLDAATLYPGSGHA